MDGNVYDQTVRDVWQLLHKAVVNHLYNQEMATNWAWWNSVYALIASLLLITGLALSLWPQPTKEKSGEKRGRIIVTSILSVVLAMSSMVIFIWTSDDKEVEHRLLNNQWLGLKSELEELRSELHTLPDGDPVSLELRAQVSAIRKRSTDLIRSETDAVDQVRLDEAWADANEVLYGKGIRTAEQAKVEYDRKKAEGQIPRRSEAPVQNDQVKAAAREVRDAR